MGERDKAKPSPSYVPLNGSMRIELIKHAQER
jgi:hypothetical protein